MHARVYTTVEQNSLAASASVNDCAESLFFVATANLFLYVWFGYAIVRS